MAEYDINAKITADSSGYTKGVETAQKSTKKFSNGLKEVINKVGQGGLTKSLANTTLALGGLKMAFSAVAEVAKKVGKTIAECTDAYKTQIIAERQLEQASQNNPFLNSQSVARLKEYASEIQKISNYGDEQIIPLMSQLASAGRKEEEILNIIKTAVDVSASGVMDLDSAVKQLNATYSGNVGLLGRQVGELKNLTEEELKNGKAVEILSQKYKGMAEQGIDTSKQLKNAFGDLKEELGAVFEKNLSPMRKYFTELISGWNESLKAKREYLDAKEKNANGKGTAETYQKEADKLGSLVDRYKDLYDLYEKYKIKREYGKATPDELTGVLNSLYEQVLNDPILRKEGVKTVFGKNGFGEWYKDIKAKYYDRLGQVKVLSQLEEKQKEKSYQIFELEELKVEKTKELNTEIGKTKEKMSEVVKESQIIFKHADVVGKPTKQRTWVDELKDKLNAIIPTIKNVASNTVKVFSKIGSVIGNIFSRAVNLFKSALEMNPDEIIDNLLVVEDKILTFFTEIIPRIPSVIESAMGSIESLLDRLFSNFDISTIYSAIDKVIKVVAKYAPKILKVLAKLIVKIADSLISALIDFFNSSGFTEVLDAIIKMIGALITGLLNHLPEIVKMVFKLVVAITKGVIEMLPQLVVEIIKALPSIIKSLVEGIWDLIVGAFKSVGGWFKSGWDWIGDKLGWWATGTNNVNKGLAVVGEQGPELVDFHGGERIYNAQNTKGILASATSGNGCNSFNVTFNNVQDTTATAMIRQLKIYNREMAINGII